jgi:hypothetical protein
VFSAPADFLGVGKHLRNRHRALSQDFEHRVLSVIEPVNVAVSATLLDFDRDVLRAAR